MLDDYEGGFISTLDRIAQASVIGAVLTFIFMLTAWPFVTVARVVVFVFSLGHVRPSYRDSFDNGFISSISLGVFLFVIFYLHIVYGARIYGNLSGSGA